MTAQPSFIEPEYGIPHFREPFVSAFSGVVEEGAALLHGFASGQAVRLVRGRGRETLTRRA